MEFGWEQEFRDFREEVRALVREHVTPELQREQREARDGHRLRGEDYFVDRGQVASHHLVAAVAVCGSVGYRHLVRLGRALAAIQCCVSFRG